MPYLPDLAEPGPIKSVGYLWTGHHYPRGKTLGLFFERLVGLVEVFVEGTGAVSPLWYSVGYHNCNLGWCKVSFGLQPSFRYGERVLNLGSSEIWVPGDKAVYRAPSLILHYLRHHKYQPPACFCEAVLNCPKPDSAEYVAAIKQIAPDAPIRLRLL